MILRPSPQIPADRILGIHARGRADAGAEGRGERVSKRRFAKVLSLGIESPRGALGPLQADVCLTSGMNAQDPVGAGLVSIYHIAAAACFKINSTIGAGSTRLWGWWPTPGLLMISIDPPNAR